MKLVFATNNAHKVKEIKIALKDWDIQGLQEAGIFEDIPETGNTLKENAFQKADYINQEYELDCFADDTGLEVDFLDGSPGVYSARYAGEKSSAKANNEKLLHALEDATERSARFRTVICLTLHGEVHFFEGVCEGEILKEYAGPEESFGYDPIFRPKGHQKSFAEMTTEEKNKISHRGIAVQKLISFLNNLG